MFGLSIIVNRTARRVFPTYTGSLTVPSDMVVSPAKLTKILFSGFTRLSSMPIFLRASLKITSTELLVSIRIRGTLKSAMVSVMTMGSLCGESSHVLSQLLNVTGGCLIWLQVASFLDAPDPSVVTAILAA